MYLKSLAIAADAVVGDRMYVSMQAARVCNSTGGDDSERELKDAACI